jgi:trehalose synthase
MPRSLAEYEPIVGRVAISQLYQLAEHLKGATVVHVNSTREGGGVAEILNWLVPMMNELGLQASWEVIEGNAGFFHATKSFHNGLQGKPTALTRSMIGDYENTIEANAARLRPILEAADFVVIHDPQPAYLLGLCPEKHGKWIWRCHIDVSKPYRRVWQYLKKKVDEYDASIFSMADFAQSMSHPQFLIAPSIDPLSPKNGELSAAYIDRIMKKYKIPRDKPIITQISRFDRFKDPLGVIQAFKIIKEGIACELVLAGGGATDDPEGAAVLEEVKEAANGDENIHILFLPPDAHKTVNALQRASTIVIQKSLQEGFGLTVTEALWKGKPVIGGNVGGIRRQVHNHHTGFLVDTPEGMALRVRYLLRRPNTIKAIGKTARQFVRENYLLTRHLREYLTLFLGLKQGLSDHLIAD